MDRKTFPGFTRMTTSEVKVFAKTLIKDGYTMEEALNFMEGIDNCLNIQASASIINRFCGKRKYNSKKARDILHGAAMLIPVPKRFLNNNG